MKEHSVVQFRKPEAVRDALSALVREGAVVPFDWTEFRVG